MSKEKDTLDAMLAQYENNNTPRYDKGESGKVYDLKNYFNTYIKDGVKTSTKIVRILPTTNNTTPFVEMWGHKCLLDGEWKTFPCLEKESSEACPFCEAHEALRATGKDSDKELAKKYNARLMYVVKVIDRDNEEEGVKFWRFNHDWRKEGILDKIQGVLRAIKKDVTNPENGRDLSISINRNQNNKPVVSAIASLDPSPLSDDEEKTKEWLSDDRTWRDVYATRNYDYMKIVVRGEVPVWDKDEKKFVDKSSKDSKESENELDSELTMSVENVKDSIVKSANLATASSDDSSDDLPF